MKKTQEETMQNAFTLRINNVVTMGLFDELLKTKIFGSKNDLANKILDAGIRDIARKHLGKRFKEDEQDEISLRDIPRALKQIEHTTDDLYVGGEINTYMIATLFNIKMEELSGVRIAAEDVKSGVYSVLPTRLHGIKKGVTRAAAKRGDK
jgi:hypothetical protein